VWSNSRKHYGWNQIAFTGIVYGLADEKHMKIDPFTLL
jgi:hypothetical protein